MTFSIVASDSERGDVGVAVASRFLAVGAIVPSAEVDVGALATQALLGTGHGRRGLALMVDGIPPDQILPALLQNDEAHEERQVGIVDRMGRSATYTGRSCPPWAGGTAGKGYAIQGNILTGPEVVTAMERAYLSTYGELIERLLAALEAGQDAGGDRRGQQSAAVLVLRSGGGLHSSSVRYVDLRVDDHRHPLVELRRLLTVWQLYYGTPSLNDRLPIDDALGRELRCLLRRSGATDLSCDGRYDQQLRDALWRLFCVEGLEQRWHTDAAIDQPALQYLRSRFG